MVKVLDLEARLDALRRSPLMGGAVSDSDLRILAAATTSRTLHAGEDVCHVGDVATTFGVILTGLLSKTGIGATTPMGPGEVFGHMPLLLRDASQRVRTTGLVATGDTVFVEVPYESLAAIDGRGLLAAVAEDAFVLLAALETRLQQTAPVRLRGT